MVLHRKFREIQFAGNLFVCHSLGHQCHQLALSVGESQLHSARFFGALAKRFFLAGNMLK
jgi:hypothetical protein